VRRDEGRAPIQTSAGGTPVSPETRRSPRRRRAIVSGLLSAALALSLASPALAGQYDYTMDLGAVDGFVTRGALHDYSYEHGTLSGFTVCVRRTANGDAFCAFSQASHSWGDSCNPASCASYYKFNSSNALVQTMTIHEEWR
jgi:hypothetical protein